MCSQFFAKPLSHVYAKNARRYLLNLQHCGGGGIISPSVFR
jgi:hypothetical protein